MPGQCQLLIDVRGQLNAVSIQMKLNAIGLRTNQVLNICAMDGSWMALAFKLVAYGNQTYENQAFSFKLIK